MARKKDHEWKKQDLINKTVEMSVSGHSQQDILKWLQVTGGCGIVWAYEIIKLSKPIINEALKDLAIDRLERTIAELELQKWNAKAANDRRLVLEIQKEINKISGLHQQRVDVTTNGKDLSITTIKLIEIKKDEDNDKD